MLRAWIVRAALAIVTAASCALTASAAEFDSPMMSDPVLPTATRVTTFPKGIAALWVEALGRPEVEYRLNAAVAIAIARDAGMTGLEATLPLLRRELERSPQHPTLRVAVAKALVAMNDHPSAAGLLRWSTDETANVREIVDPALAKWDYAPAREMWRARLDGKPSGRGTILAAECLALLRDVKAAPRLRELAVARQFPAGVRLAAARALASIQKTGLDADAAPLAGASQLDRLVAVSLLRHQSGDSAVRLLETFALDKEPAVAALALARLIEIDAALVAPMLDQVLASADANVRGFGVEAMLRRPSDDHQRRLGDRLNDAHPEVRDRARQALRDLAKESKWRAGSIREAMRGLAGNDWRGLEQGAILAAELDHRPAASRLVELLSAQRPEVLVAAGWGLRRLAVPETLAPALDYFQNCVKDGSATGAGDRNAGALDRQLTQIAQFIGLQKYQPADALLRRLVPFPFQAGPRTRAAAVWALGKLHDGKGESELTGMLMYRIVPHPGPDVEDPLVRRMAAVTLGRLKADGALPTLREFYPQKRPTLSQVDNACGWAIEQITGERMPAPGTVGIPELNWFLKPISDSGIRD